MQENIAEVIRRMALGYRREDAARTTPASQPFDPYTVMPAAEVQAAVAATEHAERIREWKQEEAASAEMERRLAPLMEAQEDARIRAKVADELKRDPVYQRAARDARQNRKDAKRRRQAKEADAVAARERQHARMLSRMLPPDTPASTPASRYRRL